MRVFPVLFMVASLHGQALAASSDWQDFNNGRARLVTGQYDGQAYIAVQLDLAPGWHSYWQYPGASGISPEFTFTGSGETAFGSVIYQAPYFFDDEAGGFYGYTGQVGFAAPLTRPQGRLSLEAFIGVCREICIPVELSLALDWQASSAPADNAFIGQVLAARPAAPSARLAIDNASFDGVSLQVVITGQALENPVLMAVPGPHDVLGSPYIAARHPDAFLVEMPAWSKLDHPLIGRSLNFIVRDGSHAIEQLVKVTDHRLMSQTEDDNEVTK
jgi:DsbC/DsbD-like thiol-disulfide interchange protein